MKVLSIIFIAALLGCQVLPKKQVRYEMRPFRDVTLSNGLPVLLVPDKRLPYFEMVLMIRSGSTADPKGFLGLSYLTADLLDKGTKKRRASVIADSLEQLGSDFNAEAMVETTELSVSGLSFHKEKLLEDFSEILLQPAFDSQEIRDAKERVKSHLVKVVDSPSKMVNLLLKSYVYGPHPYARNILGKTADVQTITRKDILKFYKENYIPQNSMLAIVGSFDDERIVSQLESYFGKWGGAKAPLLSYPPFPKISGRQILLVDNPDLKQTQIQIAHKGLSRSSPDFLKLRLANIILGHSFGSRLFEEIRTKRGLTYSIYAGLNSRKDIGLFIAPTFTRHEKVGEIIQETLNVIGKFIEGGVSRDEVLAARSILKANFPRSLETAADFAHTLMKLRFYGVPDSYLTSFYEQIDSITLSQINEVIRKYLDAKNIKIVVYGPKDKIINQVRSLGTLETISYKKFTDIK